MEKFETRFKKKNIPDALVKFFASKVHETILWF